MGESPVHHGDPEGDTAVSMRRPQVTRKTFSMGFSMRRRSVLMTGTRSSPAGSGSRDGQGAQGDTHHGGGEGPGHAEAQPEPPNPFTTPPDGPARCGRPRS
jgi:hypothetical protein